MAVAVIHNQFLSNHHSLEQHSPCRVHDHLQERDPGEEPQISAGGKDLLDQARGVAGQALPQKGSREGEGLGSADLLLVQNGYGVGAPREGTFPQLKVLILEREGESHKREHQYQYSPDVCRLEIAGRMAGQSYPVLDRFQDTA